MTSMLGRAVGYGLLHVIFSHSPSRHVFWKREVGIAVPGFEAYMFNLKMKGGLEL